MEWDKIKSLPLRQIDHETARTDKRLSMLRKTDGRIGEIFFVVEHNPDYSMFVSFFPSCDQARKAAKKFSFTDQPEQVKLSSHDEIYCGTFTMPGSQAGSACMFILGGQLTAAQRTEAFDTLSTRGVITDVVLPPGTAPLQRKKPWWKFG